MLSKVPVPLANDFVTKLHRHHPPVVGHKFSIGAINSEAELIGIVIVRRAG
jgi:hypothetical protein